MAASNETRIVLTAEDKTAAAFGSVSRGLKQMEDQAAMASRALGAIGGVLTAPITFTSSEAGTVLGLKGFAAAALGGIGSGPGALVGGLLLGVIEALTAGYVSSAYKDAVAFVLLLLVLIFMPRGLFGSKVTDRV